MTGINTLITEAFYRELSRYISSAEHSIFVVSPYITVLGAKVILNALSGHKSNKSLKLEFVTRPQGHEYITGFVEPRALLRLKEAGFEIRVLESLHSKIYLIDNETMFIGSANATAFGFGTVPDSNKEIMIQITASRRDATQIRNEYFKLAPLPEPTIDADYVDEIEALAAKYKKENDEAIQSYMTQLPPPNNVYYRGVQGLKAKREIGDFEQLNTHDFQTNKGKLKAFYSKLGAETPNYTFSIAEATGRKIKGGLYDFVVLILGEEPETVIGTPASDFSKKILPERRLSNGAWSLKVELVENRWTIKLGKHRSGSWYDADGLVWKLPASWKPGRFSAIKDGKAPKTVKRGV